ncbi:MAG: hypothetical protein IKI21_11875 [Oscillospiraceae bacterium]|nr:hypothetical protein [Oscillospiraceae bacterium]
MVAYIILLWLCIRLSAPVWVDVLCGIGVFIKTVEFGFRNAQAVKTERSD